MKNNIILISLLLFSTYLSAQQFPDSEKDGKYYKVNGANLWVVTVGTGEPMILISGGPGGAHKGLRSFDSLSVKTNVQLIFFDGFGRGKSDIAKDVKEYSLDRDIEDIEGLRKAMNLKKVSLLGHSYGSLVAQGYAVKYGQNVSHLVIANGFHSFVMWQENDNNSNHEIKVNYPEVWDELIKYREQGGISSDAKHGEICGKVPYGFLYAYNPDNFSKRGTGKPYPNAFNSALYYQMVGKDGDFYVGNDIGNFDYRQQLKDLKMPILIYGGRYDRVAVPSMMVKYKAYCPQAQFVMFELSGHNPQIEERAKLFALLSDFLKK
ncbi:alpha/beta hydrolase [Flavobacterium sp.]|uniref:alpha/beta fold hydrolase n=1 Tax=Flavobacterium sp. TaxID=239 RepID=UPI002487975F|nr:alpha/beta hydrolase [Flavobacterium sp.]MDI1317262.1 alpha/beta hydrolase [Flavobacterium sp.]